MDAERPLGLATTPGFFFPLGVLPPPPSSIPPPPWLAGALLAGRILPCGLSQSFPPPLNHPRRRRPRRRHRARRRAAGPDPPPPEVPLPAPPPPLGPPPGRSRASVDPLRPTSPLLRLRCHGLRPPAFTAPQVAPPPAVATPLPPRFPPFRGRSPIFQAAPDGSEASPASARLAPPASQGPRGPFLGGGGRVAALRAVAIGQLLLRPVVSFCVDRRPRGALLRLPRAVAFGSPLPRPSRSASPCVVACWPRGSVLRVSAAVHGPCRSAVVLRPPALPSDLAGGPISPLTGLGAAGRLLAGCSPPLPPPLLFLALGRPAPASFGAVSGLVAPPPAIAPPLVLAVPAPAPRLCFGLCARSSSTAGGSPSTWLPRVAVAPRPLLLPSRPR
ncbi:hornerin-like [Iris pallida]|uniref:Hornerin-like n=1 Tax=Iris pallida TaxID=29817 RepID=A0AAX6IGI0_IRIPA|nr:hornerin-like [Iris pallida]